MNKTPQTEALEGLQEMINSLPEGQRERVKMWGEELRDLLSEGGEDAFLAFTLIASELGAVHAEREQAEAGDHDSPAAE